MKGARGTLPTLALTVLGTGLWDAELLDLDWSAVHLDATPPVLRAVCQLQRLDGRFVRTAPKSARARRTVVLPATVAAALCQHRARWEAWAQAAT